MYAFQKQLLWSLIKDVSDRRTSTESGLFALLGIGFAQIFEPVPAVCKSKETQQYKFGSVKDIDGEKASPPVDERPSKTSLLQLPNIVQDAAFDIAVHRGLLDTFQIIIRHMKMNM